MIDNSVYSIQMRVNESCKVLCRRKLTDEEKDNFRSMIDDEYQKLALKWILESAGRAPRALVSPSTHEHDPSRRRPVVPRPFT